MVFMWERALPAKRTPWWFRYFAVFFSRVEPAPTGSGGVRINSGVCIVVGAGLGRDAGGAVAQ